jgi:hypothetical protein
MPDDASAAAERRTLAVWARRHLGRKLIPGLV